MQHTEETQVFIRLATDRTGFLCTVAGGGTNSSREELVEIAGQCDASQAARGQCRAYGNPAAVPGSLGDGPWCQISRSLASAGQASASAAVSYLFAARR